MRAARQPTVCKYSRTGSPKRRVPMASLSNFHRGEAPTHVPLQIIGQHAEQDVRAHPRRGPMVPRPCFAGQPNPGLMIGLVVDQEFSNARLPLLSAFVSDSNLTPRRQSALKLGGASFWGEIVVTQSTSSLNGTNLTINATSNA